MVILADDLGFSDLGCYGSEIATPNLDRLAAGGLRFSQFYNTARCWPTRGSLLTGYYAQVINRDALPELGGGGRGVRPKWAVLLPQLLRPLGYRSYLSGKWHIDGIPTAQGFDHSYVIEDHDRFPQSQKAFEGQQTATACRQGQRILLDDIYRRPCDRVFEGTCQRSCGSTLLSLSDLYSSALSAARALPKTLPSMPRRTRLAGTRCAPIVTLNKARSD